MKRSANPAASTCQPAHDPPRQHPIAAALIPQPTASEVKAMAESIRRSGLRFPIVLFCGMVLVGLTRLKGCILAGVTPIYEDYTGPTDAAALEQFILDAELVRRHLTQQQCRKLLAAHLRRNTQMSDRSIAEKAKCSNKTVAAVRRDMEVNGEIPKAERRVASNGHAAPVKPARAKSTDAGGTFEKDMTGEPIPPALRIRFGAPKLVTLAKWLDEVFHAAVAADRTINALQHDYPFVPSSDLLERLLCIQQETAKAATELRSGLPFAVCPSCGGSKCPTCKFSGLLPRAIHRELKSAANGAAKKDP